MPRRKYFNHSEGTPLPLAATAERRVRFEEVDSIGMVWHGRYPSFFEDGRIAFGDRYGLSYSTFAEHKIMAPIAQMHFDFLSPLRFDERVTIKTMLHWNEAMRLDFTYEIFNSTGQKAATGYTVQLLMEPCGTVLLAPPNWITDFRQKWISGFWDDCK